MGEGGASGALDVAEELTEGGMGRSNTENTAIDSSPEALGIGPAGFSQVA